MNRIRRPWPATRRDTDSVQLNTLDGNGKVGDTKAKGEDIDVNVEPTDIEHGHLQEIEVDVDRVLHDQGVKDVNADTSPYPEGKLMNPGRPDPVLTLPRSPSCCTGDR